MPSLATLRAAGREALRILTPRNHVGETAADRLFNASVLMRWPFLAEACRDCFGAYPDLARPRSFSEKLQYRKLFDRNPLIRTFCDKIASRDFARARAPEIGLADLLWSGADPSAIPFERLEPPYVIKPNNRSRKILFVRRREDVDRDAIVATCRAWLAEGHYGKAIGEWGYREVPDRLMVEAYIDELGVDAVPSDYKFFVFDGQTRFIYFSGGRGSASRTRGMYTPDWRRLPWHKKTPVEHIHLEGEAPRPSNLAEMVSIADRIGAGVDFLRVDLYNLSGRVVLGELTAYPYSGNVLIHDGSSSRKVDLEIGTYWSEPQIPRAERLRRAMTG